MGAPRGMNHVPYSSLSGGVPLAQRPHHRWIHDATMYDDVGRILDPDQTTSLTELEVFLGSKASVQAKAQPLEMCVARLVLACLARTQ